MVMGAVALAGVAVAAALMVPRLVLAPDRGGSVESGTALPIGTSYPYRLYTHCGVEFASFAGRWWRAEPPQAEPMPPPVTTGVGHYDGTTVGTMTWVANDRIRFVSNDGRLAADFLPYDREPPSCE